MTQVHIYVPKPEIAERGTGILPRSGIVGTPAPEWLSADDPGATLSGRDLDALILDFEGNKYESANIVTYADRVMIAAGRHGAHYPTVARVCLQADAVVEVGMFGDDGIQLTDREALSWWLGEFDDRELELSRAGVRPSGERI